MSKAALSFFKGMLELVFKDFLVGVLAATTKDILVKFVEKTPWTVILERLLTRTLVACLKWLSRLSTNEVWVDTVNDLLKVLQEKGLKEACPIPEEPGVNKK